MKGFNLIELMVVIGVVAILASLAAPSFIRHSNLVFLRTTVQTFEWSYMQVPVLPLDPSWTQTNVNPPTYTKTFTQPAGTLTITAPVTTGGRWSCSFSDTSYPVRC